MHDAGWIRNSVCRTTMFTPKPPPLTTTTRKYHSTNRSFEWTDLNVTTAEQGKTRVSLVVGNLLGLKEIGAGRRAAAQAVLGRCVIRAVLAVRVTIRSVPTSES
jgi:hypothetical protein